jgi:hypothetical protein
MPTSPHGVATQNNNMAIFTAVRTSEPQKWSKYGSNRFEQLFFRMHENYGKKTFLRWDYEGKNHCIIIKIFIAYAYYQDVRLVYHHHHHLYFCINVFVTLLRLPHYFYSLEPKLSQGCNLSNGSLNHDVQFALCCVLDGLSWHNRNYRHLNWQLKCV